MMHRTACSMRILITLVLCTWAQASVVITSGGIVPSGVQDSAAHEPLERQFDLSVGDLQDVDEAVRKLKVEIPGRVFVRYEDQFLLRLDAFANAGGDAQIRVGRVIARGDTEVLLRALQVQASGDAVVTLSMDMDANGTHPVQGHLLTEVVLQRPAALRKVSYGGSDAMVVDATVFHLGEDEEIHVDTKGSGELFLHSMEPVIVDKFVVAQEGSGHVQLVVPHIEAGTLEITIGGSGEVELFTEAVQADLTNIGLAGSGSCCVESPRYVTDKLHAGVLASGTISFSYGGQCQEQDVAIAGSGNIYTGALVCESVRVGELGSGNVVVQATKSLTGSVLGSGRIKYVGASPAFLQGRDPDDSNSSPTKPIAKHRASNKFKKCHRLDLPSPTAVFTVYQGDHGFFAVEWALWFGKHHRAMIPLVAVTLLAALFLWHTNSSRRARGRQLEETMPLLHP